MKFDLRKVFRQMSVAVTALNGGQNGWRRERSDRKKRRTVIS